MVIIATKKAIPQKFYLIEEGKKLEGVKMRPSDVPNFDVAIYSEHHKAWQNARYGDYVNVTKLEDIYPVTKDKFYDLYDVVGEVIVR